MIKISFLFGSKSSSMAAPKAPPSTATVKEEERKKMREGMPKKSTILTSPLGLTGEAPVGLKSLLGE